MKNGLERVFMNFNVSNDSNFEADSGYVFQRVLWQEILRIRQQMQLFFLGHTKNTESWHDRTNMLPFHDRYDKFSTRFHFDWHGLGDLMEGLPEMDVVINNQPEHTLALRMLFATKGQQPSFASYYHYLPFHYEEGEFTLDPSQHVGGFSAPFILGRNLEAAEASRWNLIGSQFGKEIFLKAYRDFRGKDFEGHLDVFSPPVESELFLDNPEKENKTKPRILYNQRLYKHYGTEALIKVFEDLSKQHDFDLVITDPTGQRSIQRTRLDPAVNEFRSYLSSLSFVKVEHCVTRDDYHRLLRSIDAAVAPIKPSALWSMAVADVLAVGSPVFCPEMGAFPELVPNTPDLLFNGPEELFEKLTAWLRGEVEFSAIDLRSNVTTHRADNAAQHLLNILESAPA